MTPLAAGSGQVQACVMRTSLTLLLLLTACAAPAPPDQTYALAYIDDTPFASRATIRFTDNNQIEGQAPCNSYSARLTAPLPVFAPGGITATEMGCDALPAEAVFFDTLSQMTSADVTESGLTLRNQDGRTMIFLRQD
jgi:heat shock protein HslJ